MALRCRNMYEYDIVMNCILRFVFHCIVLSAFVGRYSECKSMHNMSNIKFCFIVNIFMFHCNIFQRPFYLFHLPAGCAVLFVGNEERGTPS